MKSKKELQIENDKKYFDYFFNLGLGSYKERWRLTEKWYQQSFSHSKYTSYESFRVGKSKYLNEISKKH